MAHLLNAPVHINDLIIHTDGGSRGNPGPSGIGVVILTTSREQLESFGKYVGTKTNNQAEYLAVVEALKAAKKYQPHSIHFFLDSQLIVNQLNGSYRVKNPDLKPLYGEVKMACQGLNVTFEHVLRNQNHLADIEVNKALDEELGH